MKISPASLLAALTDIRQGFAYIWPELILGAFFLLIILLDLFRFRSIKSGLPALAFLGLALALAWQVQGLREPAGLLQHHIFTGLLTSDGLALYAGLLFSACGIFTILLTVLHPGLGKVFHGKGEYYAYLLALVMGLNLMAKSVNLLMLFVALELVSIASYLLTATLKDRSEAIEAGMKYILYGLLASGVMLYGMSFLYGFGGSLDFTTPAFWVNLGHISPAFFIVILLLTLAGFLFKIAAAPFHFWAPDVYEGAPTPVVAFFATAPKIAGFVVLIRLLQQVSTGVPATWQQQVILLVGGLALLTLVIGNFTALWQRKARRLLAYSSVAHAGFLLAALSPLTPNAHAAVLFYLTMLVFMNFGIFLVVQVLEERYGLRDLADLSGWGRHLPFLSIVSVVFVISLTGLPPTGGFIAKVLVFTSLWQNYAATGNALFLTLLLAGLLLTGVAFFYYIRIPYFLFFKRNLNRPEKVLETGENIVLAFFALPLLWFFFQPTWLLDLIGQVILNSK